MQKTIIWLALIIVMPALSSSAQALVFNRVDVFDARPARSFDDMEQVVGERVFYVDSQAVLHVSDGTSAGTQALLDNVARVFSSDSGMAALGDTVYVVRANMVSGVSLLSDFELWETDGTLANTRRSSLNIDLPAFEFQQSLRVAAGRLFVVGAADDDGNNNLFITDGSQAGTVSVATRSPRLSTLCAINESNFYFFDFPNNVSPDDNVIAHFNNAQLQEVVLDDPGVRFKFLGDADQIGRHCIYTTLDVETEEFEQVVSLDENENQIYYTLPIRSPDGNAFQRDRFVLTTVFQDTLVLIRASSRSPNGLSRRGDLFRLFPGEPELLTLDLDELAGQTNVLGVADVRTGADNIYIVFRLLGGSPPPLPVLMAFDGDFNPLQSVSTIREYEIASINGFDWLFDPEDQRVDRIAGNEIVNVLRHYDLDLDRLIFDENQSNAAIYAIGTDVQTDLEAVYRLDAQPTVSERLAGIWGNSDFNRTGVQINTALGGDGRTRFLFLALLAHSQDGPLWIAGSAPIIDGGNQISLTLRLTTDLDFLVPDETLFGQRSEVGTARLSVIDCDQINIEFDLTEPFGFHDLVFERVVDTVFAPLCNDD